MSFCFPISRYNTLLKTKVNQYEIQNTTHDIRVFRDKTMNNNSYPNPKSSLLKVYIGHLECISRILIHIISLQSIVLPLYPCNTLHSLEMVNQSIDGVYTKANKKFRLSILFITQLLLPLVSRESVFERAERG